MSCVLAERTNQSTQRRERTDLYGIGYGDQHRWERLETAQVGCALPAEKWTVFRCRRCGSKFKHYYDLERDVFDAMEKADVPEDCPPLKRRFTPVASKPTKIESPNDK